MQAQRDITPRKPKLSVKEVEALGYYDFMSYLGVPYYHVGGLTSTKNSLSYAGLTLQKDSDGWMRDRFFCLLPCQKNRL